MDKDILIGLQEFEDEFAFDEMIESEVENTKIEYQENLILLSNLLKEVESQIETKKPQLLKLKEMISKC